MDRWPGPGTIVIQDHGNFISFQLPLGETMDVDQGALCFQDASVNLRAYNQAIGSRLRGRAMNFQARYIEGPRRIRLPTFDPSHYRPRHD
jgi:uncharacterized protein (AIM24 family)